MILPIMPLTPNIEMRKLAAALSIPNRIARSCTINITTTEY